MMTRNSAAAATSQLQATTWATKPTIPPPSRFNLPVVMSVPQLYPIDQQRENVTVRTEHLGFLVSYEVDINPASLLI